MKATLEFAVATELDANHLVEQQTHEIERFRDGAALVPGFNHGEYI
jgi:hypothetical protein